MKKMLIKLAKNINFYIFLIFVLVCIPSAIYANAEFERRAIFSSLAVDKSDNGEYEISGLMIVESTPEQLNSNTQIVESKGRDFSEALYKLSISIGKEIGLAHCSAILVSDNLKDDDIAKVLDFCVRGNNLTQNAKLITCKGSAKDLLEVNMKNKNEIGISLAKSITNSSQYLAVSDMNLDEFFNRYYSKSASAWMSVLEVTEGSATPESGPKGGGQQEGEAPQKSIKSEGEIAVYKRGKLKFIADGDMANTINILNPKSHRGYVLLENVEDNGKTYKTISLQIDISKTNLKYYFENKVPTCEINLCLAVSINELKSDTISLDDIDEVKPDITPAIKRRLINYLNDNLNEFVKLCNENQVDFFGVSSYLYKHDPTNWKKYLTSDEKDNQFVYGVNYKLKVEVLSKM